MSKKKPKKDTDKKTKSKRASKATPTLKAEGGTRRQSASRPSTPAAKASVSRKPKARPKAPSARMPAASSATAMAELASETAPVTALYDLVCPVEGKIDGDLEFGTCMALARKHNRANPDHHAHCFQQNPSDES